MDDRNYRHLLGAEINTVDGLPVKDEYFHGFIWSFCIYAIAKTSFEDVITTVHDCGEGFCTDCPDDPHECIIDCDFGQYRDEETGACLQCLDECTLGCVNGTNCSICLDPLCADCGEYDECASCVENAVGAPSSACQCNQGYYQSASGMNCSECDERCMFCDGPGNINCSQCNDGYFLQLSSTFCFDTCPNGFASFSTFCWFP